MMSAIVFFLLATLSGMGVGSAGLPVLWMTTAETLPQLEAQGTGLVFFLLSSGAALLVHAIKTPPRGYIFPMIPCGIIGSLLGSALAYELPQALLRTLFAVFLIATGALGIFKKIPSK